MNSEKSPGWMLLPVNYQRVDRECWYPSGTPLYLKRLVRKSRQPGESHTNTVGLWSRQREPCMPTGQFRFQGAYYEYGQPAANGDDTDEASYEWGLEITVSDGSC